MIIIYFVCGCAQKAVTDDRPNIVLIMADDMGYSDVGCYGGEINTPNIDQLAYTGLRFTNFYNNGICVPSRASLLTGVYPQKVGIYTNRPAQYTNSVTLGEALKTADYRTLMVGKWHADQTPYQRGFDRYFGLTDGAANHFNPGPQRVGEPEPGRKLSTVPRGYPRRWAIDDKEFLPYETQEKDFYSTDTFTDYALDYLETYKNEDNPFFLYVAYTAPHYPLHAWPEDIEKYKDTYHIGWDSLRAQRFTRLQELGLISKNLTLGARDETVPAWDTVSNKEEWAHTMAVYAAMVDRIDQNVGRLVQKLEELGKRENTLILFLSDNGGCGEDANYTPNIPPGPVDSYRSVDAPWANASNTPYRRFKKWNHEGGIKTPLIVNWPQEIKEGRVTDEIGHIMDFMPTFLELAGGTYPQAYKGNPVAPLDGKSLLPILKGTGVSQQEVLYWQSNPQQHRAVRKGDWKLVSQGDAYETELYDLSVDPLENINLASELPDKVAELDSMFYNWAQRMDIKDQEYIEF
ncbi:arylsulfatase [Marinoscillum furvescens]|nr:arylsulfatase [Marinoscillum furvescens]